MDGPPTPAATRKGVVESDRRAILPSVEHYEIRIRGRSSKGKQAIRDHGSIWTIVSPPTMPTYVRVIRAEGDPNFEIEDADRRISSRVHQPRK